MAKPKPVAVVAKPKPIERLQGNTLGFEIPSREDIKRGLDKFLKHGGLIRKLSSEPTPRRNLVPCPEGCNQDVISE